MVQNELILYDVSVDDITQTHIFDMTNEDFEILEKCFKKSSGVTNDKKICIFSLVSDYIRNHYIWGSHNLETYIDIPKKIKKRISDGQSYMCLCLPNLKTAESKEDFHSLFEPYLLAYNVDEKYHKQIYERLDRIADRVERIIFSTMSSGSCTSSYVYMFSYSDGFLYMYNIGTVENFRYREIVEDNIFGTAPAEALLNGSICYVSTKR